MSQKFPFGIWNYLPLSESKLTDIDDWAECGLTVTMAPAISMEKDDPRDLIPFLDRAASHDMKLMVNVRDLSYATYANEGAEAYEKKLRSLHEIFKGHPALYGYVVGDEPTTPEHIEASVQCMKIQRQMDDTLSPYLNLAGAHTLALSPEYFGGRTYPEWLKYMVDESGFAVCCFDEYSQTINNVEGYHSYFRTVKPHVEAADAAGADMWGCLLSSAHIVFNKPTEHQFRWQINVSAALGCRGIFWFRFYDRVSAPDFYGSPIDEYGYKTDAFYALLRCQRRFNDHYGEILMRLKRKSSYIVGDPRGNYPNFKPGDHEYILNANIDDTGVLSFFEDDEGNEYLCIVNGCVKYFASFTVEFDTTKCSLTELHRNGATEIPFGSDNFGLGAMSNNFGVYPAQLRLFRIDKKQ